MSRTLKTVLLTFLLVFGLTAGAFAATRTVNIAFTEYVKSTSATYANSTVKWYIKGLNYNFTQLRACLENDTTGVTVSCWESWGPHDPINASITTSTPGYYRLYLYCPARNCDGYGQLSW